MSYQLIESEKARWSVSRMCRLLGVSRSGYYSWRSRVPSRRCRQDETLKRRISEAHRASRGTYGSPRIRAELVEDSPGIGRRRVARLMKDLGLRGLPKKRFVRTTRGNPSHRVAPNLLDRNFEPLGVDRVWAGDITYLWTQQGWVYLAVLLDLYSRRVIGWSLQDNLDTELTLGALEMALSRRNPKAGALHHSDRGCQYTSQDYRDRLAVAGMTVSMSRRGNCWDNSPVESFFSTLKRELAHRSAWTTRAEARADVVDYIEAFYNRRRRHSSLEAMTPVAYETINHRAN